MTLKTLLELDDAGRVTGATVWDEDNRIGAWKHGYRDVTAVSLNDKDRVRHEVHQALGAHVMENPALYPLI